MMKMHGWQFVYWFGAKENVERDVRKNFPEVIYHNGIDAVCGTPPIEYKNIILPCLDQNILRKFAECESTALKMMDRMGTINAFPYHERIRHFYKILRYQLAIVNKIKPNLIIFQSIPHLLYDYILYEICKQKEINTFIVEKTTIPGILYPMARFEKGFEEIVPLYKKNILLKAHSPTQLSRTTKKYLKKLGGTYPKAAPVHIKHKLKNFKKASISERISWAISIFKNGPPSSYEKLKGKRVEDYKKNNWFDFYFAQMKIKKTRRSLKKYYDSIVSDVDLSKPYIYVALQCQPEKSTSPMGGVYAHQYLMIDLLSKCIPNNWKIYVKEHISQYKSYQRAECSRTKIFYDDIAQLNNVHFVSLRLNSFELIDSAKVIANVTGTVGFEAVARGKPALVFGHNWYNACEGIFYTPTVKSCQKAISLIESGYKINPNNVKLFLYTLDQIGIRGYKDHIYEKYVDITPEENALAIAKALEKYIYTN